MLELGPAWENEICVCEKLDLMRDNASFFDAGSLELSLISTLFLDIKKSNLYYKLLSIYRRSAY